MVQEFSEQEVARAFVHHFSTEAQRAWPSIHADLKGIFGERFEVTREDVAAFDLALAGIAFNLQAVKNLFPAQQAEGIRHWVFQAVDIEGWGAYAINALNDYVSVFERELANVDSGGDPISATSSRLLDRWLGKGVEKLEVKFEGLDTGEVSPLLILTLNASLAAFATSWSWKAVREKFDIVPASPPVSEDSRNDSLLSQFLESAASEPYRDLIAHHIKRQSAGEIKKALVFELALLPTYLQPHVDYWAGYACGSLAPNRVFWESSTCRQAFERIIHLAIEVLPLQGRIGCVEESLRQENHDLAFQLFQIVTLNLAYLASTERSQRAFMGIRKGLFG